jgi:hypothetical protein
MMNNYCYYYYYYFFLLVSIVSSYMYELLSLKRHIVFGPTFPNQTKE